MPLMKKSDTEGERNGKTRGEASRCVIKNSDVAKKKTTPIEIG